MITTVKYMKEDSYLWKKLLEASGGKLELQSVSFIYLPGIGTYEVMLYPTTKNINYTTYIYDVKIQ
jgi:hypothetical protein